ncbi:hypothetical protein NDK25_23715 [Niallia taxi]|nr:hypothetical protein [Niallia taxi]MDE5055226.1 hypothetical protein [Niallia taxi]
MLNCLGHDTRINIIENYILEPVVHTKLLGQDFFSCTGKRLTDSYYAFNYENRKIKSDKGTLICGRPTGEDFMKLLNLSPLSLFNPLVSQTTSSSNNEGSSTNSNSPIVWHTEAEEMYNAINLIILYWGNRPIKAPMSDFLRDLRKYPSYQPYLNRVKSINTILKNNKTTIREILRVLNENNPGMKSYTFNNLHNRIIQETKENSNFI